MRSDWPIFAIWAANSKGDPPPVMQPQSVVILHPDFTPQPHLISAQTATFLIALAAHAPLQRALD